MSCDSVSRSGRYNANGVRNRCYEVSEPDFMEQEIVDDLLTARPVRRHRGRVAEVSGTVLAVGSSS